MSQNIFTFLHFLCSLPYQTERQGYRSKASTQISLLLSSYLMENRHDYKVNFLWLIFFFQDHLTSVSDRSPLWGTKASTFPLNTTPSDDSDLLLKNDTLWISAGVNLLGQHIDSCESLEDESDSLFFPFSSSCYQESSTSSALSIQESKYLQKGTCD